MHLSSLGFTSAYVSELILIRSAQNSPSVDLWSWNLPGKLVWSLQSMNWTCVPLWCCSLLVSDACSAFKKQNVKMPSILVNSLEKQLIKNTSFLKNTILYFLWCLSDKFQFQFQSGPSFLLMLQVSVLTGGVFWDSSLFSRSVKPCMSVFPPATVTLPYRPLSKQTTIYKTKNKHYLYSSSPSYR